MPTPTRHKILHDGMIGTAIGNIVQLINVGGNAGLPAVDGSLLTNLPSGSSAFNAITSGTNITAAMVVGTGASLGVSGSGTISATSIINANDATTNADMYPLWTATQGGNYTAKTSSNLKYHPSTGLLTGVDFASSALWLGTPTYKTHNDFWNLIQSSGKLTDSFKVSFHPTGGQIDVGSGECVIKVGSADDSATLSFDFAGQNNIALTDNSINHVYLDYNGGSPVINVTTNYLNVDVFTQFLLTRLYRIGDNIYGSSSKGIQLYNQFRQQQDHTFLTKGFEYAGGTVLGTDVVTSETGTRHIEITSGRWYLGYNSIQTTTVDSTTDGLNLYYRDSVSTWNVATGVTASLGNSQYNNVSSYTLQSLTAGNYGIYWIYIGMDSDINVVYGQGDYTLATARTAQPPITLPDYVQQMCHLTAKVIFKNGDTNFEQIDSAFGCHICPSFTGIHNTLDLLQGGSATERYHLTSAQATAVSSLGTMSTQNANAVAITGGTLSGITSLALAGDANFATYKAIALACDNGTTLPTSPAPTHGQWFRHTPTGRDILYQYNATLSAWIPMFSFGSATMYVDKTNGTDNQNKGYGTTTNAFASIMFAVNQIPATNAGSVTINITGESYAEAVTLQGKNWTSAFTLTLAGKILNTCACAVSGAATSYVQGGTTATTGPDTSVITKVGAFVGLSLQGYFVQYEGTGNYYPVWSNTDDTLTVCDNSVAAVTNFAVYMPETIIAYNTGTDLTVGYGQVGVVVNAVKMTNTGTTSTFILQNSTAVELINCWVNGANTANGTQSLANRLTLTKSYIYQGYANRYALTITAMAVCVSNSSLIAIAGTAVTCVRANQGASITGNPSYYKGVGVGIGLTLNGAQTTLFGQRIDNFATCCAGDDASMITYQTATYAKFTNCTNTVTKTVKSWNGTATFGDGGVTNYAQFSATGILSFTGTAYVNNLPVKDASAAYTLALYPSSSTALTANRTLTLDVVNASRTLKLSGNAVLDQDVSTAGSPTFASMQDGYCRYYQYTQSIAWSTPLTITFNNASGGEAIIRVLWAEGKDNVGGEVIFRIRGYSGGTSVVTETIVLGSAIAGHVQVDVGTASVAKIQLNPVYANVGKIKAKIEVETAERYGDTAIALTWA